MKKLQIAGLSALTLLGSMSAMHAQATTPPVGYTTVTCLANSDTIVSVPFLNSTDSLTSSVEGAITNNGATAIFAMAGINGLDVDQYVTTPSYVRFTSGTLDGNVYKIANNSATEVEIELNGDTADDITAADTFKVYNFWTLATLFPQATQTTVVESTSTRLSGRRTEIFLPDNISVGVNHSAAKVYYITSSGWLDGADKSPAASTILWPDTFFTIRHPSSVANSTSFIPTGSVDSNTSFIIPLATSSTGAQDNHLAIPRPVDVVLQDLGLVSSNAFVASSGSRLSGRRDQLFVFDNSSAALNKSASAIYYYNGTNWIDSSDGSIADTDIVKAGEGIVIRKYQTVDGSTSFWNNSPSY